MCLSCNISQHKYACDDVELLSQHKAEANIGKPTILAVGLDSTQVLQFSVVIQNLVQGITEQFKVGFVNERLQRFCCNGGKNTCCPP